MTPRTIRLTSIALQAHVPLVLHGPPGCGKTMGTYAIARSLGRPLRVIIGSLYDPTDFGGYPAVDIEAGVVRMLPNHALWGSLKLGHIILLDELSTLEQRQQAPLLRPLHEGVVGDFALPKDISWIAAMNPPEQAAGGHDLAPPMANRLMHLQVTVDTGAYVDGKIGGWPDPDVPQLPEKWEALVEVMASVTAAYLKAQGHKLMAFPQDFAQASGPWPSPRTWSMADRILAAGEGAQLREEELVELVGGCIGAGNAAEFLAWRNSLDLPNSEEVLEQWKTFKLPTRGDAQFAVLAGVVSAVIQQMTEARVLAAWHVMAAAAKQGSPDVAACAVRALAMAQIGAKGFGAPKEIVTAFAPLLSRVGMWPR